MEAAHSAYPECQRHSDCTFQQSCGAQPPPSWYALEQQHQPVNKANKYSGIHGVSGQLTASAWSLIFFNIRWKVATQNTI